MSVTRTRPQPDKTIHATKPNGIEPATIRQTRKTSHSSSSSSSSPSAGRNKSPADQLIDTDKVKRDIKKLYEYRLDQDEEWRDTAESVAATLAKLRARWKELDIQRKALTKATRQPSAAAAGNTAASKSEASSSAPATRGPGRPGRRAKRQKLE